MEEGRGRINAGRKEKDRVGSPSLLFLFGFLILLFSEFDFLIRRVKATWPEVKNVAVGTLCEV
jgi:hypothetical protein